MFYRWMTISGGKKHCSAGARLSQHDVIASGDAANGSVPPTTSHPIPAAYFTQSSDDKSIHILPLLLTVVLNIEFLQFQRN